MNLIIKLICIANKINNPRAWWLRWLLTHYQRRKRYEGASSGAMLLCAVARRRHRHNAVNVYIQFGVRAHYLPRKCLASVQHPFFVISCPTSTRSAAAIDRAVAPLSSVRAQVKMSEEEACGKALWLKCLQGIRILSQISSPPGAPAVTVPAGTIAVFLPQFRWRFN